MKDFFISYTSADRFWAEWIAWELEAAGYSTIIQAWDFRPGENFVLEMQAAASDAERTVLVLSEGYFQSSFTPSEWAAAFAQDPTGAQRRLVPVCIGKCEPKGVLRALIFIDLIGLDETTARAKLLAGIQDGRGKPMVAPAFPGAAPRPAFPGPAVASEVPAGTDAAVRPPLADPRKALEHRRLLRGAIAYLAATGFVLLAAWVGLLSVVGADDWIERGYLAYMQRFLPVPVTKEVVLVRGTDGGPLGPPGPAWRSAHAEMVDALSLAGARVIVFDLYFEDTSTKDDLALAAAIQRAQARKTAVVLGAQSFDLDDDGRARPRMSSVLAALPVRWGTLGGDPSHRRVELAHRLGEGPAWRRMAADGTAVVPSLALQAVMQYEAGGQPVAAVLRPNGEAIEIRAGIPPSARRVVPVVDARLNLIVDVADDIRALDYQKIHAQRGDPQALSDLEGKVVVIGYEVEDEKWTARGRTRYEMDVQASAIAQILHGAFLRRPPLAAQYAVILAMGALACILRTRRSWTAHTMPVRLPAPIGRRFDIPTAILAAVVLYGLAAFAVSKSLRIVPRFTYDLAALLLTYTAVGWATRGSSRPLFPRAAAAAVRDDLVA